MQVIAATKRLVGRAMIAVTACLVSVSASPQEPPTRYTSEQLRSDFSVFRRALEESHSGLYVFRNRGTMNAVFEREEAGLGSAATEWDLFRAVTRVISEIRDGHTRASLSPAAEEALDTSAAFLPFRVQVLGGRAFLVRDYSDAHSDLLGMEVVAINGRSWSSVESKMLEHTASDGTSVTGERRRLESALFFGRLYQVLYGPLDAYLLYLDDDGERRTVEVPAHPRDRIETHRVARYSRIDDAPRFEISFPSEPADTAVIRIGGFYGERYPDFIEDAFGQLAARATRRLVIDLRNNGGGRESYGQQLVAHLTREPFDFYDRAVVNHRSFPSLSSSDRPDPSYSEEDAVEAPDGRFELTEAYHGFLGTTPPRQPYFGGDVYVLADGGSFSTTTDTMTRLHQMGRATFVGSEAGGSYYGNTSGGSANLVLPHTKLRVRIPLERFFNNASGDEPVDRGLIPDVRVEPTARDLLAGRDTVVEKAFELIRLSERGVCEPAYRPFDAPSDAFDFLIGEWSVVDDEVAVAQVSVAPIFGEKVLEMRWKSGDRYEARSFLGLDEAGRWSQTWVDSSRTPFFLFYHGGIEDGIPTLYQTEIYHESEMFGEPGRSGYVCARQRFLEQQDGTIVYTWELSSNQGKSWRVQDRSIFRRRD